METFSKLLLQVFADVHRKHLESDKERERNCWIQRCRISFLFLVYLSIYLFLITARCVRESLLWINVVSHHVTPNVTKLPRLIKKSCPANLICFTVFCSDFRVVTSYFSRSKSCDQLLNIEICRKCFLSELVKRDPQDFSSMSNSVVLQGKPCVACGVVHFSSHHLIPNVLQHF